MNTRAREDQEELDEPIKVRWTGKLRGRVQNRQWDYIHNSGKDEDGEWIISEDAEPWNIACWRTLKRQKTNVVIETVEEANAMLRIMGYYEDGAGPNGITWMDGPMVEVAKRVVREIREGLKEQGYEPKQ